MIKIEEREAHPLHRAMLVINGQEAPTREMVRDLLHYNADLDNSMRLLVQNFQEHAPEAWANFLALLRDGVEQEEADNAAMNTSQSVD